MTVRTWAFRPDVGEAVLLLGMLSACAGADSGSTMAPPDSTPSPLPPPPGQWTDATRVPVARWASGAATYRGRVYVAGGFIGGPGLSGSDDVFRYDPSSDTWEQVADLPAPRVHMPLATVGDSLYAVGGLVEPGNAPPFPISTFWVYRPDIDQWEARNPLPVAVGVSGIAEVAGQLLVVGGRTGISQGDLLDSMLVYDPASDAWTRTVPVPTVRSGMAVHVIDGLLYAAGGVDATNSVVARVEVFDPSTESWSQAPRMGVIRRGLASAVLDGRLHTLTGQIGVNEVENHEGYDPDPNEWSPFAPVPTGRRDAAAATVDGIIIVVGGTVAGTAVDLVEVFSLDPD